MAPHGKVSPLNVSPLHRHRSAGAGGDWRASLARIRLQSASGTNYRDLSVVEIIDEALDLCMSDNNMSESSSASNSDLPRNYNGRNRHIPREEDHSREDGSPSESDKKQ